MAESARGMLSPGEMVLNKTQQQKLGATGGSWSTVQPSYAGDSPFFVSDAFPSLTHSVVQWQDSTSAAEYASASSILSGTQ